MSAEAIGQVLEEKRTPEGRGSVFGRGSGRRSVSGLSPLFRMRDVDWAQYVFFSSSIRIPVGSPGTRSVGLRPYSLSTPSSGAMRGIVF